MNAEFLLALEAAAAQANPTLLEDSQIFELEMEGDALSAIKMNPAVASSLRQFLSNAQTFSGNFFSGGAEDVFAVYDAEFTHSTIKDTVMMVLELFESSSAESSGLPAAAPQWMDVMTTLNGLIVQVVLAFDDPQERQVVAILMSMTGLTLLTNPALNESFPGFGSLPPTSQFSPQLLSCLALTGALYEVALDLVSLTVN